MMKNLLLFLLTAIYSIQAAAFTCYVTLVKDNCWKNYNVTVTVMNVTKGESMAKVQVPAYQLWSREKFSCEAKDSIALTAQFTPVFWQADEGKVYAAKRDWILPETVAPGARAWNITVCYAVEFSEVPVPPEATEKCQCDLKQVPEIKL